MDTISILMIQVVASAQISVLNVLLQHHAPSVLKMQTFLKEEEYALVLQDFTHQQDNVYPALEAVQLAQGQALTV
jgi:hypothetical protein